MNLIKVLTCIIARFFLGIIFVLAGINKFLNWGATEQFILETLGKWHLYTNNFFLEGLFNFIASYVGVFLGVAALLELLGGVLVLIGVFSRVGALMLTLFLIPVTILMHAFWVLSGADKDIQLVMFMKNLAILGGVLLVGVFGSGLSFGSKEIN